MGKQDRREYHECIIKVTKEEIDNMITHHVREIMKEEFPGTVDLRHYAGAVLVPTLSSDTKYAIHISERIGVDAMPTRRKSPDYLKDSECPKCEKVTPWDRTPAGQSYCGVCGYPYE